MLIFLLLYIFESSGFWQVWAWLQAALRLKGTEPLPDIVGATFSVTPTINNRETQKEANNSKQFSGVEKVAPKLSKTIDSVAFPITPTIFRSERKVLRINTV